MTKQGKFILLKGDVHGNVFWTTDDGSSQEGFEILYRGNTVEEMVKKWEGFQLKINGINYNDYGQ